MTRATLVELSKSSIEAVLDSLLGLLEDLARPYTGVASHPGHVLLSELYVLALAADSCAASWSRSLSRGRHDDDPEDAEPRDGSTELPPLDDVLVTRLFDALKNLLEPIPDNFVFPAQTLLEQVSGRNIAIPRPDALPLQGSRAALTSDDTTLAARLTELDSHAKVVVEYVTAASWSSAFDYFRNAIYNIRAAMVASAGSDTSASFQDAEKAALVVVRLLSFFWVDGTKLGLVIQELCSSYLHFRRPFQNTVAVVAPLLIMRWIDRCPREFVQLHLLHRRLDGGADTLFDMTQTVVDNARRRALLYPLQTTLLFLLPDVFEVASNLREAKSSSMAKKVLFLDGLRKALRNGNEQAGYCLVALLRAARHFDIDSDSALVSYAMDVQDEVRDAVFRPAPPTTQNAVFDQDMMTAAFVSLAHLNLDGVDTLVESCLSPSAPESFKIAAIQACCYFAQQQYAGQYQELFDKAIPSMQTLLEVSERSGGNSFPTAVAPPNSYVNNDYFCRLRMQGRWKRQRNRVTGLQPSHAAS